MRPKRTFREDERAIEGLPIRLVIALVIGVAALAVMLNILSGVGTVGQTEVGVEYPNGSVVNISDINTDDGHTMTIEAYSADEEPVQNPTILVTSGSARLSSPISKETDDGDNVVEITFKKESVELAPDQERGTLEVEVVPPSDSNWVDRRENSAIIVIDA